MTEDQFNAARDQGRWFDIFKEAFERDGAGNILMRTALATVAATFGSAARGITFDPATAGKIKLTAAGSDANIDVELVGKGNGGAVLKLGQPLNYGRVYSPLLMSQGWVGKIRDISASAASLGIAPNGLIFATAFGTTVRVVNPLKGTVEASITVGAGASGVAYCPTTDRIYVASNTAGTVAVINPETFAVTSTIVMAAGIGEIAYCPSNDRLYVSNPTSGEVKAIDPATEGVVATIGVATARAICYCQSNDRVYIAGSAGVAVINPGTNTIVTTVTVGTTPRGVCYSPVNDRIYVANDGSGSVSVIDPGTNTVTATIAIGGTPQLCTYSPIHGLVYVTFSGGTVVVIRPANNSVYRSFAVNSTPYHILFSPHDSLVYVANSGSSNISVLP